MKNLFSFFRRNNEEDAGDESIPWLQTPSIYEHILAHLDPETGRLSGDAVTLPDEEPRWDFTQQRWAPGAFEGVLSGRLSVSPSL